MALDLNAPVVEHGGPGLGPLPEYSPVLLEEETIDITVIGPQEVPRMQLASDDWTDE